MEKAQKKESNNQEVTVLILLSKVAEQRKCKMKEIISVPKEAMLGSNAEWEIYTNIFTTFSTLWVPQIEHKKVFLCVYLWCHFAVLFLASLKLLNKQPLLYPHAKLTSRGFIKSPYLGEFVFLIHPLFSPQHMSPSLWVLT